MNKPKHDTHTEAKTLQNEHIVVKVSHGAGCHVTMEIEVNPKETEAAYQKAAKNVTKEVSIPGFRKGKAPAALVQDGFQKAIHKEWGDLITTLGVNEALNLTKLYPYKNDEFSSFKLEKLSLEEGAKMIVSFDSFPTIPDVDLKDLQMKDVPEEKISKKDVADFIEQTQLYFAKWNDVTDRAAQDKDHIVLDIEKITEPTEMICENQRAKLIKGEMADWIYRSVIGMTPGQSIEMMSEKPKNSCHDDTCNDPDHQHDDAHFEPILCKITLRSILQPELPEIDDAFAIKVGCKDASEFQQRAEEATQNRANSNRQNKRRNQMYDLLLSKYPFEVPSGLVKRNVQNYITETLNEQEDPQQRAAFQQMILNEKEKLAESLAHKIRAEYLIGKLAHQFNIKVSNDDVSQEIMQELVMSGAMKDSKNVQQKQEQISKRIVANKLTEKTLDYLIEHSLMQ